MQNRHQRAPDWSCGSCGVRVFGSKSACFKCHAPRQPGAVPDDVAQKGEGGHYKRGARGRAGHGGQMQATHTLPPPPPLSPSHTLHPMTKPHSLVETAVVEHLMSFEAPLELMQRDEYERMRLESTLRSRGQFHTCRVVIFGSAGSGLRVGNKSDVDMCVLLPPHVGSSGARVREWLRQAEAMLRTVEAAYPEAARLLDGVEAAQRGSRIAALDLDTQLKRLNGLDEKRNRLNEKREVVVKLRVQEAAGAGGAGEEGSSALLSAVDVGDVAGNDGRAHGADEANADESPPVADVEAGEAAAAPVVATSEHSPEHTSRGRRRAKGEANGEAKGGGNGGGSNGGGSNGGGSNGGGSNGGGMAGGGKADAQANEFEEAITECNHANEYNQAKELDEAITECNHAITECTAKTANLRIALREAEAAARDATQKLQAPVDVGEEPLGMQHVRQARQAVAMAEQEVEQEVQREKRVLFPLASLLTSQGYTGVTAVARARVGVVKCISPNGIPIDCVVNNGLATFNTALLRTYATSFPTFRQLAILIKGWATARGLNTAQNGHLSSYGHVLTVLHYCIAACFPPVCLDLQVSAARPSPSFAHLRSPSLTFAHLRSPSLTFAHLRSPPSARRQISLHGCR